MANEFPTFTPTREGAKTGRLILGKGAYTETLMMIDQPSRGRILEVDGQGQVLAIDFHGAGLATESVRRKTDHYISPPDLPDIDLTGLPKQPGIPDEGELTLMVNKQGLVPLVSSDLIPD